MANLDAAFSALADPTRRAILARLALGEADGDGAGRAVRDDPARHLPASEGARRRGADHRAASRARKRPCRLAPDGIAAIDQWLAMLREALEANYDRLDDVLADMKPEKVKGQVMSKLTLKTEGDTPCRRHAALCGAAGGGLSRAYRAGADAEMAARSRRLDDAGLHQRGQARRQDPL